MGNNLFFYFCLPSALTCQILHKDVTSSLTLSRKMTQSCALIQFPSYIRFLITYVLVFRYPHCLYFLELLQNPNFRNAMAHPANKELAHRQQFYYWKNYRNNRLKHILPKPLPETATAAVPPALPPAALNVPPVPSPAPPQPPSSMQYGVGPGSNTAKNEPRNSGIEKRKRK
ncbi:hypothetical protein ACS0TY_036249 [Phlomoides rotata]